MNLDVITANKKINGTCIIGLSNGKLKKESIKYDPKTINNIKDKFWWFAGNLRIDKKEIKKIKRYTQPPIIPSSAAYSKKSLCALYGII